MFREVAVEGTLRDGTEPASGRTSRQRRQQNTGSAGRQAGVSEGQEQGGGGMVTASEERGMGPWGPGRGYSGHGRRAAGEWRQTSALVQQTLSFQRRRKPPSTEGWDCGRGSGTWSGGNWTHASITVQVPPPQCGYRFPVLAQPTCGRRPATHITSPGGRQGR